jgi:hypothetical protein
VPYDVPQQRAGKANAENMHTPIQIYVSIDGKNHGPYSHDEVRQYLATGQLQPQMQAWGEGMTDWQPLEALPEFAAPGAGTGPVRGRSRAGLYISLAVCAVALCAVAGWLVWRGKPSKTAERMTTAGNPATEAASLFAGHPDWPKTLDELNTWYVEPPAGQNAAEVFLKGYDLISANIAANAKNGNLPYTGTASTPSPGVPVPAAMKKAIAAFMQQNTNAWDLLKQGSSLSQSRYPIEFAKGKDTLFPHLPHVKQAGQAAAVFALGYADTQRGKEAGESVFITYSIARSLEDEPTLISQLVRLAVNELATRSLEQTVNRVALPPQSLTQLQDLLGRLADREASGESFNRGYVGEELTGLVIFDMPAEELQKAIESIGVNFPNGTNGSFANVQKTSLKNLPAERQFYVDNWNQVFAARKEPFPSRLKAGEPAADPRARQFPFNSIFILSPGNSSLKEAEDLTRLRLAQTALALERFRAAGGSRYPDTLADLCPKLLASVPEDPFDGQPLRYFNSGNGYTLHSIGPPGASDTTLKSLSFEVSNPPAPSAARP